MVRRVVGCVFPLVLSGIIFLILFNNFSNGILILIFLLSINVLISLGLSRLQNNSRYIVSFTFGSVCVVAIIGAFLFLEGFFYLFLPKEYSQVYGFATRNREQQIYNRFKADLIFDQLNDTPCQGPSNINDSIESLQWHKPSGHFTYCGYDPNQHTKYINRIKWNKSGYFDHDYNLTKFENVYRVVVVGDSYVESVQVPLEKTFHKLTETALNQTSLIQHSVRYEVVALGNSGAGQKRNLEVLKTDGIKYNPDMVMVTICGNDFCDDDPILKQEFILSGGDLTPLVRRLTDHGYLSLAFMVKRLEDILRNSVNIAPELLQWSREDIPKVDTAWQRSLDYLRASRDFCESRGITFVAVYLGSELEVRFIIEPRAAIASLESMGGPHARMNWDMTKSIKRVRDYCKEFRINLMSLIGPLVEAQRRTGLVVFADHYSFWGHKAVAQTLTGIIREYTQRGKTIKNAIELCSGYLEDGLPNGEGIAELVRQASYQPSYEPLTVSANNP